MHELYNAMADGKGKEVLERILDNLASYANFHFAAEKTEMVKHKYPDYEAHRGKHQAMLGKVTLTNEVSDFLSDWLNKHIVGTDQQYSSFMNGVGVN
ncbi:MAG: hemerythrin domain-containing protein [Candidatus Scalindua sp.]